MWEDPSMKYENCVGYEFRVRVAFLLTHPSNYFHKYSYMYSLIALLFTLLIVIFFAVYFQLFALVRVCSLLNLYVILTLAVSSLFLCFYFLFILSRSPPFLSFNEHVSCAQEFFYVFVAFVNHLWHDHLLCGMLLCIHFYIQVYVC